MISFVQKWRNTILALFLLLTGLMFFVPNAHASQQCLYPASGTTFYVDTVNGNDMSSTTEIQRQYICNQGHGLTPGAAFKSLQSVVNYMGEVNSYLGLSTPTLVHVDFNEGRIGATESLSTFHNLQTVIQPNSASTSVDTIFELTGISVEIEGFDFLPGGGIFTGSDQYENLKVSNNTFGPGSFLAVFGYYYYYSFGFITFTNDIEISNNVFDQSTVNVNSTVGETHFSANEFDLTDIFIQGTDENTVFSSNEFSAPTSSASINIFNSYGLSLYSNEFVIGQALDAYNVNEVIVQYNIVGDNTSLNPTTFHLEDSNLKAFTGNEIFGADIALYMEGVSKTVTADFVDYNLIDSLVTLWGVSNAAMEFRNVDFTTSYSSTSGINSNIIKDATQGILLVDSEIDRMNSNDLSLITHGAVILKNTDLDSFSNNTINDARRGLVVTEGSELTMVDNNDVLSVKFGVICEEHEGDFNGYLEFSNDLVLSQDVCIDTLSNNYMDVANLGVGSVNTSIRNILDNDILTLDSGVALYGTYVNQFNENLLTQSASASGEGLRLFLSEIASYEGNGTSYFRKGLDVDLSTIGFISNSFFHDNDRSSIDLEYSNVDLITGSVFVGSDVQIYLQQTNLSQPVLIFQNTFYDYQDKGIDEYNSLSHISSNVFAHLGSQNAIEGGIIEYLDHNFYDFNTGTVWNFLTLSQTQLNGLSQYGQMGTGASLLDPLNLDFTPLVSSGLINRAESSLSSSANSVDIYGNSRPSCGRLDIGAVEYQFSSETDSDSDGICDEYEINVLNTDPNSVDSDGDGLSDDEELFIYWTDPNDADMDSDGLSDYEELITYGTDPILDDTDGDRLLDGEEINTYFSDPFSEDGDDDTLLDFDEVSFYFTDPMNEDSDGDDFRDDYEVSESTDPLDSTDTPEITVTVISHERFEYQYDGITGSTLYTAYDDPSPHTVDMTMGDSYIFEMQMWTDGVFAFEYDEEAYLGSITVYYCGNETTITPWILDSSTNCSDIPIQAYSSSDLSIPVWLDISGYYSFEDFDEWYMPLTSQTWMRTYPAFKIEIQ